MYKKTVSQGDSFRFKMLVAGESGNEYKKVV